MPARQIGRRVKKGSAARPRRPSGKWGAAAVSQPYDPEGDLAKRFQVPTDQYVRRFALQESWTDGPDGKPLATPVTAEFDGVLLAPVVQGGHITRLKPVQVAGFAELRQFLTSEPGRHKRLLEAVGDYSFDTDSIISNSTSNVSDPTRLITDPVPLMNGPYYKQLYWYDYLRMHSECVHSNTAIPLLDGRTVPVSEVKAGDWVYSCNIEGRIVPGEVTRAWRTRESAPLVKVIVSPSSKAKAHNLAAHRKRGARYKEVLCTPDHLFLMRDGQWREAKDLQPGDRLMPLYRDPVGAGYERVYHPGEDRWEYTHRAMFAEPAETVHHLNGNKRDNRPANLAAYTASDHMREHGPATFKALLDDPDRRPEFLAKRAAWRNDPKKARAWSKKVSKATKAVWSDPERKAARDAWRNDPEKVQAWREKISAAAARREAAKRKPLNHTVVAVEDGGTGEVWDLTIDRHHNFAIGAGVFVHNCFEAVNKSPLAASAVKIMTRFVVGRGISFHIKEQRCEAVWTEFWERNNMREKLRACARDLPWAGEILIRYYERVPGYLSVRIVDPSTCQEIVTDPEDLEHVFFYHFMWPTQYQMFTAGQIPIQKFVVQQVPPTNVQHLKINVASQEKRGRSDLLPALPWIKRFNDYYNGVTVKAMLEANLVWKLKIQGDDADVSRIMAEVGQLPFPPPGGMWGENEAMDLQPMTAQLTASRGSSGIGQQIASIVATSMNLPSEYFNIEGTGPARATALVRTDPAVKTIEDRQQLLTEMLEEMYDRVISSAILAGRLPRDLARFEPERRAGDSPNALLAPAEPPGPGQNPAPGGAPPSAGGFGRGPGVGAPPGVGGPGGAQARPGAAQGPSRTSWSPGFGPGQPRRFEPVPNGR